MPIDKQSVVQRHQQSAGDTGSTRVQVALLTERINSLTDLCTYPWNFVVVDVNGDVRPCCWASIRTGNLAEAPDFDAVWNGPEAQRLRADFLAGQLPGGCIDKHCGVSAKWLERSAKPLKRRGRASRSRSRLSKFKSKDFARSVRTFKMS